MAGLQRLKHCFRGRNGTSNQRPEEDPLVKWMIWVLKWAV